MEVAEVPKSGEPLIVGCVYVRSDLHARFGGNRTAGIVPSRVEPYVLLFHTEEPAKQFYNDGYTPSGIYRYSGMGSRGDMTWNFANVAVKNHKANDTRLLLFERVQRKNGLWRLAAEMECVDFVIERVPDSDGRERDAIIFQLHPV